MWLEGKHDTRNGWPFVETLSAFADGLVEYSQELVPKGSGSWFTPAISRNGRCRDQDIEWITMLNFDADDVGDWNGCIDTFESAGLAYVIQRSSSHTFEHPKFHVYLPLAAWWQGEKPEWRQIYRHCVAWFSVAVGLRFDLSLPLYGFDLATDRLGQPWFFSARRSSSQPAPELRWAAGKALDLEAFLSVSGFQPRFQCERSRLLTVSAPAA